MKRYFGQVNFEFDAEDDEQAADVSRACAAAVFDHPAVRYVDDELPEEDVRE